MRAHAPGPRHAARRLLQEPFRILFPAAVLAGMVGVGHWLAYAAGWSDGYSGFVHAGIQMQVYVTAFIAGFLMTAMPRFSGTRPAAPAETLVVVALLAGVVGALWAGRWLLAQAAFVAALLALLGFFAVRIAERRRRGAPPRVQPPVALAWLPFALLHGLGGAVLLAGGQAGWFPRWALAAGRPMLQEGFVLAVVVGVGGFLAPRLMGTYRLPRPAGEGGEARRGRLQAIAHGAGGALLLASFAAHGFGFVREADLFRALLVTAFLAASRTLSRRPVVGDPYVRYFWIAIWMVVAGLWSAALLPAYRVEALHLVFLGGYSLMTFAVATMVVLSHTGEAQRLRGPIRVLRLTGGATLAALGLRVSAVVVPDLYFELLGAAATVWLAGALVWLGHVAPRLVRTIPAVELARNHEQSKLRVLQSREAACAAD
jgi:uncharacterized protein involved in response to NO